MLLWLIIALGRAAPVPEPLIPWIDWVQSETAEKRCVTVRDAPVCLWPGQLTADLTETGGTFTFLLWAEQPSAVRLPGGRGAWPQAVRADGVALALYERAGVPYADLPPGTHIITGTWRWDALPPRLLLPPDLALSALTARGQRLTRPRLDSDGALLLADSASAQTERLEMDVSRRISDGVPLRVTTRLDLRAAGGGREMDLGPALLEHTRPVQILSALPARVDPQGHLWVQLRPGAWSVEIEALHDGPAATLAPPDPTHAAWPDREAWVFVPDPEVRAVQLSGPPAVDPARTALPEDWRGHSAFLVEPKTPLKLEEIRRGEPVPSPNQLSLRRELWLDTAGAAFTVQDRFSGTMNQKWRLNIVSPGTAGHVAVNEVDQVITQSADGQGVELRAAILDMVAESRWPRQTEMPAVGWDADVHRLEAVLHLPPGWHLLAVGGADTVEGSALSRWTLLDLLLVAVLGFAFARLWRWPWGLAAVAAFAFTRHLPGAPVGLWLLALAAAAAHPRVGAGRARSMLQATHTLAGLALVAILIPLALREVRTAHAPATEKPAAGAQTYEEGMLNASADLLRSESVSRAPSKNKKYAEVQWQQDPAAVVQTGPGLPRWSWSQATLGWRGPVPSDHTLSLYLLGPVGFIVLTWARVLLLGALALRLLRGSLPKQLFTSLILLFLVSTPDDARAQMPSPELLSALEARLSKAPACAPNCVSSPKVSLEATESHLTLRAELHASAAGAWPLPGPAETWIPENISINGQNSPLMRREGVLYARLEPGVHHLEAIGALPPAPSLTLQWELPPQLLDFHSDTWRIEGIRADGSLDTSLQLVRLNGAPGASDDELQPWLQLDRQLDLGIPWRATTTFSRSGDLDRPISIKIPLLPGESVSDTEVEVQDGAVLISLGRGAREARWTSTLAERPELTLVAAEDAPWSESWQVRCSPVTACAVQGPPALRHLTDGQWSPLWRPWPGERLTLTTHRPGAVKGASVTVESAQLTVRPGNRLTESSLDLDIRASQGGTQRVTLPAQAELLSAAIDGQRTPLQLQGGQVSIPLRPGAQRAVLTWQEPSAVKLRYQPAAVRVEGTTANVEVQVIPPDERWIFWVDGPLWGPRPMLWLRVLLTAALAIALGRSRQTPLRTYEWLLLGLGSTQMPWLIVLPVAGWFVSYRARERSAPKTWWRFNLVQLTLIGWTLITLLTLYAAVHVGLLVEPSFQLRGDGSSADSLRWFADRVEGPLPAPTLWSAPTWTWQMAHLLWALWLGIRLSKWLPWSLRALRQGGLYKLPQHSGK